MIVYKVTADGDEFKGIEAQFDGLAPVIPVTITFDTSELESYTIVLNKMDAKYFGEALIKLSEEI